MSTEKQVVTDPHPHIGTDSDKLITAQSHTGGKIRNKGGRPRGAVGNKAIKEAMKRKFGRVVTAQKFGALVQLVYDQAMGVDDKPCKASQKLIFEYGMIKPQNEVEQASSGGGVTIVIGSMEREEKVIDHT